ncbi:MAG: hypothetical protein K2N27_05545 [Ruminococcus sp.]|nr:hypothetical protein [Ruminococcus sp.]
MMSSDEMTERVINKLNEHRKKVSRRNEIVRKITFGIVDNEKKKGMGYMNTKSGILALTASMALIITATVSVFSLNMGKNITPEHTEMTDIPTTDESTEEMTDIPTTDESTEKMTDIPTTDESTEEMTDVSTTEEFTEETSVPTEDEVTQQFRELELHEDSKRVYDTFDEVHEIIQKAQQEYETNGAWLIDREKYMPYFSDSEMINSLESKSYIYHMMLNSVDYFNTAKGTMIYEGMGIEFQTNIAEKYAYEKENNCYSYYYYDEKLYHVSDDNRTYYISFGGQKSGFSMSNNDRLVTASDDGYDVAIQRHDMTNLVIAGNSCLLPQSMAMSRLSMFDAWDIVSTENILGFDCAVIEGTHADNSFRMWIDIAHGILMKYAENDEVKIETTSLELDGEVEKKVFDATGYTEK